ncbi:energy transducer TonB [Shewanella mangrovisoli]|uniref:energy transducer TonB n=1 Tax=Shewanella mangrovisoli TaxID=2864211 RepID=UPI0035B702B2
MLKTVKISIFNILLLAVALSILDVKANDEPIQYLDLTSNDKSKLLNEYWVTLKRQEPQYPMDAARDGISGCVELVVGIKSNGRSGGYKVKKSYPEGVFDNYAAAALAHWRWKATDKNSAKVPVLTTIQMDFMIGNAKNKSEVKTQCENPQNLITPSK